MIKKLSKHGDDLVLILDPSILAQLQIDEETALEVTTDGRTLVVSPVQDEEYLRRFEQAMNSVNERYAKTFKRLAE
jgi:antitoxin component of MazEF toxin-antitoxin module